MRIAHVSDCYLPRLGGIEVQVTELTRRQAAAGDTVDVITATPGRTVRSGTEQIDGVTVHRVTARLPFELPVHPRTRAHVAPLLRTIRPDVVHVHLGVVSPFAWGGIRAAVEVGLPVLVTVHSVWGWAARSGYGVTDRLAHWTSRGVQPAAVSHLAADRIAAALPAGTRVLVTPNGVDPEDWNAAERDPDRTATPVKFVTAMRLAPRKRALPLLKMFAAAHREVPATRLAIAGDGPQRKRLAEFLAAEGLAGDVDLLGRLTRPQLRDRYLASDVFVQPSIMESFGLAALEARATGLPVIARRQSGLTDFVTDQVQGLLVDDDRGMVQAMVRIASDRALRAAITSNNCRHQPDQTWSNVLKTVNAAYDRAMLESP